MFLEINQDGRLEFFVRVDRGAVAHIWQMAPGGAWSDWFKHPSPGNDPVGGFNVVGARNQDERIEIFAPDGNEEVFHKWQGAPNAGFGDWASLGVPPAGLGGGLAVVRDGAGRLNVFCIGIEDQSIYGIAQTAPNGNWSQWGRIGPVQGQLFKTPAVGADQDGRIEVFALASSANKNDIVHIWQKESGGSWSSWFSHHAPWAFTQPVLGASDDGRLELLAYGANDLKQKWQQAINLNWSNWFEHGVKGGQFLSLPVFARHADGRLEFRLSSVDGAIYGKTQVAANAQFGDWFSDRIPGVKTIDDLAMALNGEGRLELFAFGFDGNYHHKWQISPNGDWSDWESLGRP